jgi:uncharacterized protein (TIGR02996 family)
MHADELALLNSIICAPEEDAPRLAYAKWLDEHGGGARAKYIRWKVLGPAAIGMVGPLSEFCERREEFNAIRRAAVAAFSDAAPAGCSQYFLQEDRYNRGLLTSIEADGAVLAPRLPELFRIAPITELHVPKNAFELLRCPEMRQVRTLALGYDNWTVTRAEMLQALLTCPYLDGLDQLSLGSVWFYDSKWTGEDDCYEDRLSTEDWDQLFARFGPRLVDGRLNALRQPLTPLKPWPDRPIP